MLCRCVEGFSIPLPSRKTPASADVVGANELKILDMADLPLENLEMSERIRVLFRFFVDTYLGFV
jgi:hypothetical protein